MKNKKHYRHVIIRGATKDLTDMCNILTPLVKRTKHLNRYNVIMFDGCLFLDAEYNIQLFLVFDMKQKPKDRIIRKLLYNGHDMDGCINMSINDSTQMGYIEFLKMCQYATNTVTHISSDIWGNSMLPWTLKHSYMKQVHVINNEKLGDRLVYPNDLDTDKKYTTHVKGKGGVFGKGWVFCGVDNGRYSYMF